MPQRQQQVSSPHPHGAGDPGAGYHQHDALVAGIESMKDVCAGIGASTVVVVGFRGERLHLLPGELLAGGAHADDLLGIEVGNLNHHAIGNNLTAV